MIIVLIYITQAAYDKAGQGPKIKIRVEQRERPVTLKR